MRRRISCSQSAVALIGFAMIAAPSARADNVDVLIEFDRTPGARERAVVETAGGQVRRMFHLVRGAAARVPQERLDDLRRNPHVLSVSPDAQGRWTDELADSWGVVRIGSVDAFDTYAMDGQGVRLAILDSGIDADHPELVDALAGGWDFENDDPGPDDVAGHGTAVAGVVAAARDGVGVVGVAPGVDLYMLKVGTSGPIASAVIDALQWAVDNDIQVTNSSFDLSPVQNLTLVEQAYEAAWQAGLLNVASAGNGGPLAQPKPPASYSNVIAVSATDANDALADFSSAGPTVELAAPGDQIMTTAMVPIQGAPLYQTTSGTSFSAPHVAGAAALVLSAGVLDANGNGFLNDEVRQILTQTAEDLGDPGRDDLFGFGLADAYAAVSEALPCIGDLDDNGVVDLDDLTIQLSNFGSVGVGFAEGDMDGDTDVDLDDLTVLLGNFGATCA